MDPWNEKTPTGDIRKNHDAALGDTGDNDTGVPDTTQGISNRPGDRDPDRDRERPPQDTGEDA